MMSPYASTRSQAGDSLIEVLITLIILAIGLLGLAGLQGRMQLSAMESYQRAQALIILNDMVSRISSNQVNAATYVTGSANPLGAGMTCPTATSTRQQVDAGEWCNSLQGAAETASSGKVGAMIGGRGCVESLGSNTYMITVAWQGMAPISAPPAGVACGQNSYNSGAGCANDLCRRAVTSVVTIGNL